MTTFTPSSFRTSSSMRSSAILPPSRRANSGLFGSDRFDVERDFGTLRSSSRKSDSGTASRAEPIYYQFNLEKRSKVRLSLENQRNFNPFTDLIRQPSVFAAVLDDRGRNLQSFDKVRPDKTKEFTSDRLDEGTYYLKVSVSGSRRSVDYELQLRRASSGIFGSGIFS